MLNTPQEVSTIKVCPGCGIEKPNTEYYKDKNRKDGLAHYCKECKRAKDRERANSRSDIERSNLEAGKRARKAGKRVYAFTEEELLKAWEKLGIDRDHCYYCGKPLDWAKGAEKYNQAHLEHKKPLSAKRAVHSKNNVVPSCADCNLRKHDKDMLEVVHTLITAPGFEYKGTSDLSGLVGPDSGLRAVFVEGPGASLIPLQAPEKGDGNDD